MKWTMPIAVLALPVTAAAQERVRSGDFRIMSAQRIADAILPLGHEPIAAVRFETMGPFRPPPPFVATIRAIVFYSASAPISGDFCIQNEIIAEITPIPEDDAAWLDSPPQLQRVTRRRQLYRYRPPGATCDGTAPHFSIDGMATGQGLDAFRALVGAVRRAEAPGRAVLPFTVSCEAMLCGSARTVMRNLAYDVVSSAEPVPAAQLTGRDRISRLGRMPGRIVVIFRSSTSDVRHLSIEAVLHRAQIEHVAVSESIITY